jgi:GNAT superfamily N-acetyltransferase
VCNGAVRIDRVDPTDLDLDTAEAMAEVDNESLDEAGLNLPRAVAPSLLGELRLGWDGTPAAGVWLAYDEARLVGFLVAEFPTWENTSTAAFAGGVLPSYRRRGVGRALHEAGLAAALAAGRPTTYAGTFEGTDGVPALEALGYRRLSSDAVRRITLAGVPAGLWDGLYDEAAGVATDYEVLRQVGPMPPDQVADMVALYAAINDAPSSDPDTEPDMWDAERVSRVGEAMDRRRQTVYRVLARHRDTGAWAGHSLLCVDEFRPSIGFQEDTTVVREHRGHRLGLLMKADMLRWLSRERPEVAATDTWNDVTNQHMIAVNEELGGRVVATHHSYRGGPR